MTLALGIADQAMRQSLLFKLGVIDWLPGETLFSLASRHHLVSGNANPSETCQQLFGHHRIGSSHDLPARVGYLCRQANGLLGSVNHVVESHSIFPFYFPFHSPSRCANWVAQMDSGSASQMKAELGLSASRFGASHPLKACPRCMTQDVLDHHISYWHVDHQLPGVLVCQTHRVPLLTSAAKSSGVNRFGWVLPMNAELVTRNSLAEPGAVHFALAEGAKAMWSLPPTFQFHSSLLRATYQVGLIDSGFMSVSGRISLSAFDRVLESLLTALGKPEEFSWLSTETGTVAEKFLRHVSTASPRESRHPLKHLLLVLALFGSWAGFWKVYRSLSENQSDTNGDLHPSAKHFEPQQEARIDERKNRFLSLLERDGLNVTAAARAVHIAVGTAMAWAAAAGKPTRRRPKVLDTPRRDALIAALKCGAEKKDAALTAGVSVQTVTRLLLTEPGLHELWEQIRFSKAQHNARRAWQKAIRALPVASSNEWRRLQPASYAWLYRNDRVWLKEAIEHRKQPVFPRRRTFQWHRRDVELAQQIRTAALNWQDLHPGHRLKISILCSQMPVLKSRLSSLGKLPLTRTALTDVCAKRRTTAQDRML